MAGNRIPRNARGLEITLKKDTYKHKAGDVIKLHYDEIYGWVGGGCRWFVSYLRDKEFCSVRVTRCV